MYKIKQYGKTAHNALNKGILWNKMSLNGVHVLILQKQISELWGQCNKELA
jgi:hypothetical protein